MRPVRGGINNALAPRGIAFESGDLAPHGKTIQANRHRAAVGSWWSQLEVKWTSQREGVGHILASAIREARNL